MKNDDQLLTEELDEPLIEDQRISLKGNIFLKSRHRFRLRSSTKCGGIMLTAECLLYTEVEMEILYFCDFLHTVTWDPLSPDFLVFYHLM